MCHRRGWQQKRWGYRATTLPTRSPPVGWHFPGAFVIHVAAMLARPLLVPLSTQMASAVESAYEPMRLAQPESP